MNLSFVRGRQTIARSLGQAHVQRRSEGHGHEAARCSA